MRNIINYIRSLFCKHEFTFEEDYYTFKNEYKTRDGMKISQLCKKCGYHKSFWKYGR